MPLDPTSLRPLPSTPALSGVLETLAFFRDPDFARSRFERYGDVYETTLLGQRTVFIRGGQAVGDLFAQGDAVQGWWPDSVRKLLGPLSLANRNGVDHKARRRVVGQLFTTVALKRYSPAIVALVNELSHDLLGWAAPVALVARLRRFAFSVIASTVLGLDPVDRERGTGPKMQLTAGPSYVGSSLAYFRRGNGQQRRVRPGPQLRLQLPALLPRRGHPGLQKPRSHRQSCFRR